MIAVHNTPRMVAQWLAHPLYVQEDVGSNLGILSGFMMTLSMFGKG